MAELVFPHEGHPTVVTNNVQLQPAERGAWPGRRTWELRPNDGEESIALWRGWGKALSGWGADGAKALRLRQSRPFRAAQVKRRGSGTGWSRLCPSPQALPSHTEMFGLYLRITGPSKVLHGVMSPDLRALGLDTGDPQWPSDLVPRQPQSHRARKPPGHFSYNIQTRWHRHGLRLWLVEASDIGHELAVALWPGLSEHGPCRVALGGGVFESQRRRSGSSRRPGCPVQGLPGRHNGTSPSAGS